MITPVEKALFDEPLPIAANFHSFIFLPFTAAPGMSCARIGLSRLFGRTSKTDTSTGKSAAAFDFFTFVTTTDLIDLLMTLRTFHAHFIYPFIMG